MRLTRGPAAAALPLALLLAVAACSGSGSPVASPKSSTKPTPAASLAGLTISPASGSTDTAPDQGITVTASRGKIDHVTVTSGGAPVSGSLGASLGDGNTAWHTQWALNVAQSYTVTATATSHTGQTVTATSSFRTMTPSQTFQTQIFEGYNQ
ncbi:MAG: Ig-like domain-containing protein, partial [Streptosporangiaceae bacterium]